MKSVATHGALLALVTVAALATWLSPEDTDAGDATISVWNHDPDDVVEVAFHSDERSLLLERRTTADQRSYLWARQTIRRAPVPPPAGADAESAEEAGAPDDPEATEDSDPTTVAGSETDADAGPDPDVAEGPEEPEGVAEAQEPEEQVEEFPVGTAGETVVEGLAELRAVRDLGDATEERRADFGLADTVSTITVRMRDGGTRELAVGNSVVGGGNRYVLDIERNRILVLPVSLIRPLEASETLRLSEYQPFEADEVASVTVHARGSERSFERSTSGAPPQPVWSPVGDDRPDPAFGSFMEQVGQLWISSYPADVAADTLDTVLRIDYQDAGGDEIGYLEVFRSPATDDDAQPTYLMRTGRTIVLGEIYFQLGERLEQDTESLFRDGSGSTARRSTGPVSAAAGP